MFSLFFHVRFSWYIINAWFVKRLNGCDSDKRFTSFRIRAKAVLEVVAGAGLS